MSICINVIFIITPVLCNQSKSSKSKHSGHNSLILSFIKFRLYASFPPETNAILTPPIPPSSTSLLAGKAAGELNWQSHLCQKQGGGLRRGHFLTAEEAVSGRAPIPAGVNHLLVHLMALALVFVCQHPRVRTCPCALLARMSSKWLITCKWDGGLSGTKPTQEVLCLPCHLTCIMRLGLSGREKSDSSIYHSLSLFHLLGITACSTAHAANNRRSEKYTMSCGFASGILPFAVLFLANNLQDIQSF